VNSDQAVEYDRRMAREIREGKLYTSEE